MFGQQSGSSARSMSARRRVRKSCSPSRISTGVTPRREKNVSMFMASSDVGHTTCQPGDVVVNTMWAWMGGPRCCRAGRDREFVVCGCTGRCPARAFSPAYAELLLTVDALHQRIHAPI